MTRPFARLSIRIALLVLVSTGCARRAAETPPEPSIPAPPSSASSAAPTDREPTPTSTETIALDLAPAFFAYDSYVLDAAARAALDRVARQLRERSDLSITIEGHCDERGTIEYNQALGEQRARAARDYLAAAGVPASRIEIVSYGRERPFAMGSDESAWAQNRRAHLVGR